MAETLARKILASHLLEGELIPGREITIRVDQTLTQDSTGTMVYLQLDALAPDAIRTDLSVAYIDHNLMQAGFENADDHAFIRSVCEKYGIRYVKPGGGICHQVHLEQFAKPGTTLIGSDSHTPTAGGAGAIAIGAGGLDIALGMATGEYTLTMPKIYGIELTGKPGPAINGKDIILTVLKELTVKGGVGHIMEYFGEGLKHLSVPTRATITNMGAELGATTSIFPSDENTRDYLKRQGRESDYQPLTADPGAAYDEHLVIDLSGVVPMIAQPHSPDKVTTVKELEDERDHPADERAHDRHERREEHHHDDRDDERHPQDQRAEAHTGGVDRGHRELGAGVGTQARPAVAEGGVEMLAACRRHPADEEHPQLLALVQEEQQRNQAQEDARDGLHSGVPDLDRARGQHVRVLREPTAGLVQRRLEAVSGDVEGAFLEPVDAPVEAGGDLVPHHGDPAGELGGDQSDRGEHHTHEPEDDDGGGQHPRNPCRNSVHQGSEHGGQQNRDRHGADYQRQPGDALSDEPGARHDEHQARRPGRGQPDRVGQVIACDPNGLLGNHEEQLRVCDQAMSPNRRANQGSSSRRPSDHTA